MVGLLFISFFYSMEISVKSRNPPQLSFG